MTTMLMMLYDVLLMLCAGPIDAMMPQTTAH